MRNSLGEPKDDVERLVLMSKAAGNWTRSITATDKAIGRGKSGAATMKSERHWMLEYRRLGGKLPVRQIGR